MAQAGGKIPEKLPAALETARSEIKKLLGTQSDFRGRIADTMAALASPWVILAISPP